MTRRRGLVALAVLAVAEVAFLTPSRVQLPRNVARQGGPSGLEKSQELLHQLADDMDELVKLLPEEGEEDDEVIVQAEATQAATSEAALAPASNEVLSALDVQGLQAAPEYGENKYIATVDQIQSIVDERVKKYTAVIKSFERYIEELEEELDKTEVELEEKDKILQEEANRRQEAEAELAKLTHQHEELELSYQAAQEAKATSAEIMTDLDQKAEQLADQAARGELSEEDAAKLEEALILAQAAKFKATVDTDRRQGELQEVQSAAEEAAQRAAEAEQRQQHLSEELEKLRSELKDVQEQRDTETQRREVADARFSQLIQRLQERVGGKRG